MNKTCYRCMKSKSLDSFSKNRTKKDELQDDCRKCRAIQRRARNKKHSEEDKLYREQNPNKIKAHHDINNGIRAGKITRAKICQTIGCNETKNIHGHHEDYNKPLEVEWLCQSCHHTRHTKQGEGE